MTFSMDGHGDHPTTVELCCDTNGCGLKLSTRMKWGESQKDTEARLWASTRGWTQRGNKHDCPQHAR